MLYLSCTLSMTNERFKGRKKAASSMTDRNDGGFLFHYYGGKKQKVNPIQFSWDERSEHIPIRSSKGLLFDKSGIVVPFLTLQPSPVVSSRVALYLFFWYLRLPIHRKISPYLSFFLVLSCLACPCPFLKFALQ